MPNDNQQTNTNPVMPTDDAVAPIAPDEPVAAVASDDEETGKVTADNPVVVAPEKAEPENAMAKVAEKIAEAHNILVALSSDPSVDELATAIGLSIYLDKLGKRATAIYSGATPNAIEFLKPEEMFEDNPDTLQDFVIALSKEKADHLRYKLDGDYVKIYITPYKTRIAAEDLEFSYGDYNVDLVLALNVANGVDLDGALREHGRIMHDAAIVNMTTGKPGKFGEIEWSKMGASSVAEMVAELLYNASGKAGIEEAEATALLTGIVAATDRFSKANTSPETLRIASRLMESGADQQLITENITADLDNKFFSFSASSGSSGSGLGSEGGALDGTALSIEHEGVVLEPEGEVQSDEGAASEAPVEEKVENGSGDLAPSADFLAEASEGADVGEDASGMLDELKATEASLAEAGAVTVPEEGNEPVRLGEDSGGSLGEPEKVVAPSADFLADPLASGTNKYGQMLEDALAEANGENNPLVRELNAAPVANPGVGGDLLPPPPAPPVDLNAAMPVENLGAAPVMPSEPVAPIAPEAPVVAPAVDPSAFQIPGM